ncbi:hypothetical protein TrVE_jg12393 [Triparma verrucosa]|uniref:Uncharacterized protein n=1 Tax=Triparma verrucosa TaxID=1606542 RepID=A0A9W7FBF1_9STRA|nr:hypothetical protein TrVE_jg12393 [Triparma verrucosa]
MSAVPLSPRADQHALNLKVSMILCCSGPLSSSSTSSGSDSLDVQIKLYALSSVLVYRVQFWLIEYSTNQHPNSDLISQDSVGSASIVYVCRVDRSSYERLVEADYNLKYRESGARRIVLILKGGGGEGGDLREQEERRSVEEEVRRLCRDRGMIAIEVEEGENVLDKVFSRLVGLLEIGERGLMRDPAFLLGKNVDLGGYLLESDDFINTLFTSPS